MRALWVRRGGRPATRRTSSQDELRAQPSPLRASETQLRDRDPQVDRPLQPPPSGREARRGPRARWRERGRARPRAAWTNGAACTTPARFRTWGTARSPWGPTCRTARKRCRSQTARSAKRVLTSGASYGSRRPTRARSSSAAASRRVRHEVLPAGPVLRRRATGSARTGRPPEGRRRQCPDGSVRRRKARHVAYIGSFVGRLRGRSAGAGCGRAAARGGTGARSGGRRQWINVSRALSSSQPCLPHARNRMRLHELRRICP